MALLANFFGRLVVTVSLQADLGDFSVCFVLFLVNEVEHATCSKVNKAIKTWVGEQLGFKMAKLSTHIGHAGMLLIWDFLPIFDTNFAHTTPCYAMHCVGNGTNQYFKQLIGHCVTKNDLKRSQKDLGIYLKDFQTWFCVLTFNFSNEIIGKIRPPRIWQTLNSMNFKQCY